MKYWLVNFMYGIPFVQVIMPTDESGRVITRGMKVLNTIELIIGFVLVIVLVRLWLRDRF